MDRLRIIVLGTLASDPYAGMAWMHMQIVAGLRRLGHDAHYFETSSTWPYDPARQTRVCDSEYALPYLARVAKSFGLDGCWAYRRSYLDREWFGLEEERARRLLLEADLVLNVAGATRPHEDGLRVGNLVYFGTDPVYHEVTYASGDPETRAIVDEHVAMVTYGENIGNPDCPIPPLPMLRAKTRQPILIDLWKNGPPRAPAFTTVGNWRQRGREVAFNGEIYQWSKHYEFEKFLELPTMIRTPLEIATNLADLGSIHHGEGTVVATLGMLPEERRALEKVGWRLIEARAFTTDPWPYRDYVRTSSGEFTVARDLNVRLRSGWFSERSACYLGAGRPVITQDTGFGCALPTGEGLFAVSTIQDAVAAFEAVESDYERHSRAASEIADEYFRAEKVLARLLYDLGF